jgi:hypothetical protein
MPQPFANAIDSLPVAKPVGPVPELVPVIDLVPDPPVMEVLPTAAYAISTDDGYEVVDDLPRPGFIRRLWNGICSLTEWLFGATSLIFGLSFLSAVPILQFLALGYLLEVCGRIARTGKISAGFIGIRFAARLGGVALGVLLWWLPLWLLSGLANSAAIIDPEGSISRWWKLGLVVVSTLVIFHVITAILCGGKLRYFFWPLNFLWLIRPFFRGELYQNARDGLWNTVVQLRLPYYFWLGFRGFIGGYLWLALPLVLLGFGHRFPVLGILGGLLLIPIVMYVPFLQVRFARDQAMRAFRQPWSVRQDFKRAPIAFAFALTVTLTLAMPLYLLKIEAIPRDLVFLENLVFLMFIFPSKLLLGWAYSRAMKREKPRNFFLRWFIRFLIVPVVFAYVLVVFTSQHIGWSGIASLFEQHAFLLPVPFISFGD